METGKELNAKILKITLTIKNKYPELSKYIEEMPITIPNKNNPEITLIELKKYLESLNLLYTKHLINQN